MTAEGAAPRGYFDIVRSLTNDPEVLAAVERAEAATAATRGKWSNLTSEYDAFAERMMRTNRRLFAVAVFTSLWAVVWMVVALCLI